MSKSVIKLKNQFFASCPTGLEELLLKEVSSLGIAETDSVKGGIHFTALGPQVLELLLSSRIASRVFRKTFQFEIKKEKDLYGMAREIKWKSLFPLEQTFKIMVIQGVSRDGTKRSQFKNTMFLAQNFKDGIVDRFRDDCNGERPSVDKEMPDYSIMLRVEPNNDVYSKAEMVTVLADLTGEPLSNRGYRAKSVAAPLRENLGAALVMLAGYEGTETFIDPMCGSGTVIIESLLIKGNIPPSFRKLDRYRWDFGKHIWFEKDQYLTAAWDELLTKYRQKLEDGMQSLKDSKFKTFASDLDRRSLKATSENLREANLEDFVEVKNADACERNVDADAGVLVTNPPYGERIGEANDLPAMYYDLGENLKQNFKNWRAYIFTGNLPLLKKISLRTSKKVILWNGNIESRLAEYLMY